MSPEVLELKKKLNIKEDLEYNPNIHNLILKGVPKTYITHLAYCLGLKRKEMLELLPISDTHLRRIGSKEKLSSQVTEHVVAIGEVVVSGYIIVNNPKDFREWLFEDNVVLNNKKPYSFLSTIHGCGVLKTIFHKIAHGIPF